MTAACNFATKIRATDMLHACTHTRLLVQAYNVVLNTGAVDHCRPKVHNIHFGLSSIKCLGQRGGKYRTDFRYFRYFIVGIRYCKYRRRYRYRYLKISTVSFFRYTDPRLVSNFPQWTVTVIGLQSDRRCEQDRKLIESVRNSEPKRSNILQLLQVQFFRCVPPLNQTHYVQWSKQDSRGGASSYYFTSGHNKLIF